MSFRKNLAATAVATFVTLSGAAVLTGPSAVAEPVSKTATAKAFDAQVNLLADAMRADTVGEVRAVINEAPVPAAQKKSLRADLSGLSSKVTIGGEAPGAHGLTETPTDLMRESILRAIDPTQYECKDTELAGWASRHFNGPLDELLAIENPTLEQVQEMMKYLGPLLTIVSTRTLDVPTYDLLLNPDDARYSDFPSEGARLTQDFKQLKKFWDINGSKIKFRSLNSSLMDMSTQDEFRRVGYTSLFTQGITDPSLAPEIQERGQLIKDALSVVYWITPENPVYTANAFAYIYSGGRLTKDKVLTYGEGLLQAQRDLGYAKVGPSAVMGHEYGHHIQYSLDVFEEYTDTAEGTRRTELMADAFGNYFVGHDKGENATRAQERESVAMMRLTGDCGFRSAGHHGTPNQREAASEWGLDLAEASEPTIASTKSLVKKFDKALPSFVVPDAPVK